MKNLSIIVGCLNDNDIPKQIKNDIIIIEALQKNIEKIKKFKCYNYFVSNKCKNINLYYSDTIKPELKLLKENKNDIIDDILKHEELKQYEKLKHIKSIKSKRFKTITLNSFFKKIKIPKNTNIEIYISEDVDIEIVNNKLKKDYNIIKLIKNNKVIYQKL
tara:strand:- start:3427 stop:3909 length:483 start_codon:yes stop_codon:yes gene_type:complete